LNNFLNNYNYIIIHFYPVKIILHILSRQFYSQVGEYQSKQDIKYQLL